MGVVLVTGGAGYIGSVACKALKEQGFIPITYDDLSTGHKESVKYGPFVEGNLLDKDLLEKTFKLYRPIAVMHFAASALVVESVLNPGMYYENNVTASVNLLEAMRKYKTKYIVFSSTCATYGEPIKTPIDETHPQNPISPYGKSKRMVEMILEDYQPLGINHVSLRYFNAAGASLDGTLGSLIENETHLIPLLMQQALGQRESFTIFGTDFPTKDGTAIRDFIHVEDLASAHIKSLYYLFQNNGSVSLNLGTGQGYSVKEIICAIESFSRKKLAIKEGPRRKKEPSILVANNSKAKKTLFFQCQHSDIKTIIESAYHWHQSVATLTRVT